MTQGPKRWLPALPFAALVLTSVLSRWFDEGYLLGNLWAIAFVACTLLVPPLSKRSVWLGYGALLFPWIVLGLYLWSDWGDLHVGWK